MTSVHEPIAAVLKAAGASFAPLIDVEVEQIPSMSVYVIEPGESFELATPVEMVREEPLETASHPTQPVAPTGVARAALEGTSSVVQGGLAEMPRAKPAKIYDSMPYDNNMSGMLARNERKEKPAHPDFQGSCEIAGVQYWICGWIKEAKPESKMAGKRFFSLAFKAKDAPTQETTQLSTPKAVETQDEDVPF